MTDKQIEKAEATLPKFKPGQKIIYTAEKLQLRNELKCRRMINSILCYNGENDILKNQYMQHHIRTLGVETVQRLCNEQIADFRQAVVVRNAFTDSEGLSYNSIKWADE